MSEGRSAANRGTRGFWYGPVATTTWRVEYVSPAADTAANASSSRRSAVMRVA